MSVTAWAWGVAALLASAVGTGIARRYALHRQLIDAPEARRNHRIATPRGGGIAILLVMLLALAALAIAHPQHARTLLLAGVSLLLVGGVGWWDDHRPLPVLPRLSMHLVAALCLGVAGMLAGWPLWVSAAGVLAALVLTNFWNFMDGIDGIAALQAAIVAFALAVLAMPPWQAFCLALAGASLGFVGWNFPRARIFMGDVGSGTLGIALAWGWCALAAGDARRGLLPLFALAPFLLDAGLTLATRMLARERWWEGHSRHSYQLAARRLGRHVPVTLGYSAAALTGAILAIGLRNAGIAFILSLLAAWYFTLAIVWRALRVPAGHRVERSME